MTVKEMQFAASVGRLYFSFVTGNVYNHTYHKEQMVFEHPLHRQTQQGSEIETVPVGFLLTFLEIETQIEKKIYVATVQKTLSKQRN